MTLEHDLLDTFNPFHAYNFMHVAVLLRSLLAMRSYTHGSHTYIIIFLTNRSLHSLRQSILLLIHTDDERADMYKLWGRGGKAASCVLLPNCLQNLSEVTS